MKQLSPSPRSHPPANTSGPFFFTTATRLAHAPGVLRSHARAKSLPAAPVSLGATRPSSSTCPSVKHARPEPCVHDTFRVRIHVWHPPLPPPPRPGSQNPKVAPGGRPPTSPDPAIAANRASH